MASKPVVQEQQARGIRKQKNGQAEGKHRRALGDIGNLVPAPAIEGKPQISRPITRSFGAKLLANAQKEAENGKKPLGELVKGVAVRKGGAVTKAAACKKDSNKLKPEAVSVISPENEVKCKEENPKICRKPKGGSSNKKAYSSILTARSKAACGLTKKAKAIIEDIDATDTNNELAAVEYIEDIYKFYKETEEDGKVGDYMGSQPDTNYKMRAILVDWLIEVHKKFELVPECLYLTVNIVDRFLSMKAVPRMELQLVGMSSMLIACKYEETWPIEVKDLIAISDNAYVREQVLVMEKAILGKLEWYLTVPTPYVFLVRFTKASVPADPEVENMVFFFAELGLMDYSTITLYCPSKVAASAVYAARCTLNKTPFWTETLKHHTGYSEEQILDSAKLLVGLHVAAGNNKLKSVYRKYSSPERCAVALLPAARSSLLSASS